MASHDNSSNAIGSDVTSLSWSHNNIAGNFIEVGVSLALGTGGDSVTGVTYNAVSLTSAGAPAIQSTFYLSHLWFGEAPTAGSQTVVATFSATVAHAVCGATTVTDGVSVSGYTTATGVNAAPTVVVPSEAGQLVLDNVCYSFPRTATPGGGQTVNWDQATSGLQGLSSREAGDTNVTMSWSMTNAQDWASAGLSIAGSGAPPNDLGTRDEFAITQRAG